MKLEARKALLVRLGEYLSLENDDWQAAKQRASGSNPWFTPEFMDLAARNIAGQFLKREKLDELAEQYRLPEENPSPKKVGIVMAGNIPLVGFHDLLCVFLTGHIAWVKPSSKDDVLVRFLVEKMMSWHPEAASLIILADLLKGCDAYIATGSNNTSRYFEYYFRNHPIIIRKNRTSVALLTGKETREELEALADDVYQFFGLGCRNVTKLYVPEGYDFIPLLEVFKKYNYLADHNKYKNNYDYNLAVLILNKRYFMSNESILLVEDPSVFSPIAQLNYEYYKNEEEARNTVRKDESVQCLVSRQDIPFGGAQCPQIRDYADGVDTMAFLMRI